MLFLPMRHLAILAATSIFTLQTLAQIDLGSASTFGIIASTAITSTGSTIINGQLGISPNTASSITGFPPGKSDDIHASDDVALQARNDTITAYYAAVALDPTADITGQELGGLILQPGTYHASSSVGITSRLILDGQNSPNAQFVFQIGSTLVTAAASSVVLINGAKACNVFWQVGSSATLGTRSDFVGNILALTSISLNEGVNVAGGLYALNAAVTLINDKVDAQQCVGQNSGGASSVSAIASLTLESSSLSSDSSGFTPTTDPEVSSTPEPLSFSSNTSDFTPMTKLVISSTSQPLSSSPSNNELTSTTDPVALSTLELSSSSSYSSELTPTTELVISSTSQPLSSSPGSSQFTPTTAPVIFSTPEPLSSSPGSSELTPKTDRVALSTLEASSSSTDSSEFTPLTSTVVTPTAASVVQPSSVAVSRPSTSSSLNTSLFQAPPETSSIRPFSETSPRTIPTLSSTLSSNTRTPSLSSPYSSSTVLSILRTSSLSSPYSASTVVSILRTSSLSSPSPSSTVLSVLRTSSLSSSSPSPSPSSKSTFFTSITTTILNPTTIRKTTSSLPLSTHTSVLPNPTDLLGITTINGNPFIKLTYYEPTCTCVTTTVVPLTITPPPITGLPPIIGLPSLVAPLPLITPPPLITPGPTKFNIVVKGGVSYTPSKYYESTCSCVQTKNIQLPFARAADIDTMIDGIPCTISKYYESGCDCVKTATVPVKILGLGTM